MPFQLIYSSWAAPGLTITDLKEMLEESRVRNTAHGITGVLILVDGVFLQILEGEKPDVLQLYENIKRDPRHHGAKLYHQGETKEHAFASWSMAYLTPNDEEVSQWAELEGSTTIDKVLLFLEREPGRLPAMALNILKAIAEP